MPELPEVETVRRMLEATVVGRRITRTTLSGLRLRTAIPAILSSRVRGRSFLGARRVGKYLLLDLEGDVTLLSHLGMSGRWLFYAGSKRPRLPHVHVRFGFADGGALWFQDPRRFGLLSIHATREAERTPALASLGPDPIHSPPSARTLGAAARGSRVAVKNFLLDQRKVAGIGNIYASEILFRSRIHPSRKADSLESQEWGRIAKETRRVLGEAIDRMGTTFSAYRTLWNEPGSYGEQLRVYDRAGQECRRCGGPIRRIVQGQRSTFYCARCQPGPS